MRYPKKKVKTYIVLMWLLLFSTAYAGSFYVDNGDRTPSRKTDRDQSLFINQTPLKGFGTLDAARLINQSSIIFQGGNSVVKGKVSNFNPTTILIDMHQVPEASFFYVIDRHDDYGFGSKRSVQAGSQRFGASSAKRHQ